jgi:hypothetical protein
MKPLLEKEKSHQLVVFLLHSNDEVNVFEKFVMSMHSMNEE